MLNRLEAKHWALIAGFLVSTATVIGGLDHWADMTKPAIVGGMLAQIGTLLGALFAGAPKNPNVTAARHPARRSSDPDTTTPMGSVSDATRRNLITEDTRP